MEFFANHLNGNYLLSILPQEDIEIDWVRAAIAYGNDSTTLIDNCIDNGRKLDIWMRYDHTVPVAPALLKYLLKNINKNIFCYLVPDVLHSKVIWWKNYGVYIGSANLTDRAWMTNIEFGVFIPEEDLEEDNQLQEIEFFFDALSECEKIFPLTQEIIQEQEELKRIRSEALRKIDEKCSAKRRVGHWDGPAVVQKQKSYEKKKENFIAEWNDSLSILRSLAEKAPEYRPKWLKEDVPAAWQADQFLHAYYYNQVVDGVRHPYEEEHEKNKADPASAVKEAMIWWSKLPEPPSEEDYNCHTRAPVIRTLLSHDKLNTLTLDGFAEICRSNHSTMDHVRRLNPTIVGLENKTYSVDEKLNAFAASLWAKRNRKGQSIIDLLKYVLAGGSPADMPQRLFDAANSNDYKFAHFGTNQIAEMIGWARPELFPPRNGRTSKSLKALGFRVALY